MAIRYKMIRLPVDVYSKYWGIKRKMETDLTKINNKPVSLTFPQFFNTLVTYNENWIEIDLEKLSGAFISMRRRR